MCINDNNECVVMLQNIHFSLFFFSVHKCRRKIRTIQQQRKKNDEKSKKRKNQKKRKKQLKQFNFAFRNKTKSIQKIIKKQ